jgi:hypothetical protein
MDDNSRFDPAGKYNPGTHKAPKHAEEPIKLECDPGGHEVHAEAPVES